MIQSIDQELIDRIKKGDTAPFADIYNDHYDEIRRFAYYRVSLNQSLAEDLVSSVFLKFFEYVSRGNPVDHVRGFLFQSVKNELARFFRDVKPETNLDDIEFMLYSADDLEREVEFMYEKEKALKVLRELSDEQRQIVSLRYFDQLSYKEIAELIGKSEGSIRVIAHRAVKELYRLYHL